MLTAPGRSREHAQEVDRLLGNGGMEVRTAQ